MSRDARYWIFADIQYVDIFLFFFIINIFIYFHIQQHNIYKKKTKKTRQQTYTQYPKKYPKKKIAASAASPLAASPHARRSREISAAGCGYSKPAGWLPSSRVAAPPSPPFTGVRAVVRGSPRPAVRGRSRRRPATDSSPPSPPFTGVHAAVCGSPSPPFAGDHAAVRGISRHRPQLTLGHRPATDLGPVDTVHMFQPGVPF